MQTQKGIASVILIVVIVIFVAVGGFFAYQYFAPKTQPVVQTQQNQNQNDQTAGWKTYTDDVAGITFQYPNKLDSNYISLWQKPSVIITIQGGDAAAQVIASGCLIKSSTSANPISIVGSLSVGNMNFCISSTGDGTPGTYYNTYYYTTLRNGNYYTLTYAVSKISCGNIGGPTMSSSDPNYQRYQTCMSDENTNYDSIVIQPIKQSVSTFKFTK